MTRRGMFWKKRVPTMGTGLAAPDVSRLVNARKHVTSLVSYLHLVYLFIPMIPGEKESTSHGALFAYCTHSLRHYCERLSVDCQFDDTYTSIKMLLHVTQLSNTIYYERLLYAVQGDAKRRSYSEAVIEGALRTERIFMGDSIL